MAGFLFDWIFAENVFMNPFNFDFSTVILKSFAKIKFSWVTIFTQSSNH